MDRTEKTGLLKGSITVAIILLCAMLLLNIFVFLYYGLINPGHVIESEPVRYVKDWDVVSEGNGGQILGNTLPEGITDNEYLYFETRRDVSVYINEELRTDYIEKRDVNVPGGNFRRFMMSVPLKQTDSGAEIRIHCTTLQDSDREIPDFFISTRSGALDHLFKQYGLAFSLSLVVLAFSFVAFVVSILLSIWYRQQIDMMYGALAIFTIAAWLITDSTLFPLLFGVYHVNGLLSFMFCLMIPLPLGVYLSVMQRSWTNRSMSVAIVIAILNAVVWPFLHFTGIIPFYYLIDVANLVLVILAAMGIATLTVDFTRGNIGKYRYTFIGFLGFLIGCLIELTCIIFSVPNYRESIPMVVGLGFLLTFIVIQQVVDLRKVNMEKQHAIDISEAKTRFLASMSHEIRTPINAILGMNEMILRENHDKEIAEYARSIKTSGKMLLMLVNDVLDFTKIEAGKMEITETDFLVSDMLYDVISMIQERAGEKEIEIKTVIVDEVPNEMISDEFRIRQILVNLMNNAVKYTEKGTITLLIGGKDTEEGFEILLRVKDTGKGIRKEEQEHLFEAFSRADMKANINIEGTGLGLAIVKSIVESMNGEYGVESEYGVGSEFWVRLPVKYKNTELLQSDFMERRSDKAADTVSCSFIAPDAKILAVDDNQSNLTIVKLFLKQNHIVPDLCSSGKRAIELCKEKKYDLILLDHMMPKPDGIETLHRIRESEASLNRDTKVIVLTANAVAGSQQMYLSEGFDGYLTKPLDSGLLEETVRTMLPGEKVKDPVSGEQETNGKVAASEPDTRSMRSCLSAIEGLDYETALEYCGGEEEMLRVILGDIAAEAPARAERMRKNLEQHDLAAYRIDAHAVKSSMATVGLKAFSERAKKHEFAARDNDAAFIEKDAETFIADYLEIVGKLHACLPLEG